MSDQDEANRRKLDEIKQRLADLQARAKALQEADEAAKKTEK